MYNRSAFLELLHVDGGTEDEIKKIAKLLGEFLHTFFPISPKNDTGTYPFSKREESKLVQHEC
jgi:hypothetical protein